MDSENSPPASASAETPKAEGEERQSLEASSSEGSAANDASRSPEEESQSQLPGDPRALNEEQPPTKEQY